MEDSYKHKGMRRSLVTKLREKGICDENVLSAIGNVPRHFFFDPEFVEHAYQDKAFPIGEGQTISQPYTVAYQTQLLQVQPGDKILEIGTGSGYQCCVLLEIGAKVYTIELNQPLFKEAKSRLRSMGYQAHFFLGDGSKGLPSQAPFDGILVTAGAPKVPAQLLNQLKIGGRLVIPVGGSKVQKMLRLTKTSSGQLVKEVFNDFRFVPLLGVQGWQ